MDSHKRQLRDSLEEVIEPGYIELCELAIPIDESEEFYKGVLAGITSFGGIFINMKDESYSLEEYLKLFEQLVGGLSIVAINRLENM